MKRIKLTQGKYATVDDEIYKILNQFKWYSMRKDQYWYAARSKWTPEKIYTDKMHFFIVGKPILSHLVIDHINGDGLDNRRENLRILSVRGNAQNRYTHRNGQLLGAHWTPNRNKWQSSIKINGREKYLGIFKTPQEANARYYEELKKLPE